MIKELADTKLISMMMFSLVFHYLHNFILYTFTLLMPRNIYFEESNLFFLANCQALQILRYKVS